METMQHGHKKHLYGLKCAKEQRYEKITRASKFLLAVDFNKNGLHYAFERVRAKCCNVKMLYERANAEE